jgi:hypothetical protein
MDGRETAKIIRAATKQRRSSAKTVLIVAESGKRYRLLL